MFPDRANQIGSAGQIRKKLVEHQQLLGATDGRVWVGVLDRATDQVVATRGSLHDVVDPGTIGIRIAVDEREDVAACGARADVAGDRRESAACRANGSHGRQRTLRQLGRFVPARVDDHYLESVLGFLHDERSEASLDRTARVVRRHDHRDEGRCAGLDGNDHAGPTCACKNSASDTAGGAV